MALDRRRERLTELQNTVAANQASIKAIFENSDKLGRLETDSEKDSIINLNKANEPLIKEMGDLKAILAIRETPEVGASDGGAGTAGQGQDRLNPRQVGALKSLGEMFSEDPEISQYLSKLSKNTSTSQRVESPKFSIPGPFLKAGRLSYLKTLLTGASGEQGVTTTSAGTLVFPDYKPIVDEFYQKPLQVRDLVTQGQTGSDTVEYVRITGVVNAAGMVPEAANITDGDSSGRKPQSEMDFARIVDTVRTLAHWIPATNRALMDAAQLRTLVDEFLRYGIEELIESQILLGDGTGENFLGIFHTPNINVQQFDTDILRTTRKMRTLIRVNGHTSATAYVLNPFDWELIDLTKDAQGRYYFGGPTVMGQKVLWGIPVVESELLTEGQVLCGNWKMAQIWDRMESQVSVSNSHNDFFIRNLVAILGEFRAAFGVIRPQAFCLAGTISGS